MGSLLKGFHLQNACHFVGEDKMIALGCMIDIDDWLIHSRIRKKISMVEMISDFKSDRTLLFFFARQPESRVGAQQYLFWHTSPATHLTPAFCREITTNHKILDVTKKSQKKKAKPNKLCNYKCITVPHYIIETHNQSINQINHDRRRY